MDNKGIGLVEVLVSTTLGLLLFTAILVTIYYLIVLNESAKKEAAVYQHLAAAMERVTNTPVNSLNSQYPNGQSVANYSMNEFNTMVQNSPVEGETITVYYPNGASANPREILVTVGWQERGRTRTSSMRTYKRG